MAIRVGDSVILDAVELVFWTLLVGGAAVSTGVEVFFEGAFIRATALDSLAVAVDTFANFQLRSPIPITLVATSTFDSFPVATVNILITNLPSRRKTIGVRFQLFGLIKLKSGRVRYWIPSSCVRAVFPSCSSASPAPRHALYFAPSTAATPAATSQTLEVIPVG